jgi:hypothetical protein
MIDMIDMIINFFAVIGFVTSVFGLWVLWANFK